MKLNKLRLITLLSAIGVVISAYLTHIHYQIASRVETECIVGTACATLNASVYSEILGVPVALIGFLGLAAIFILSLMKRQKLIFYLSLLGLIFVTYLLYVELVIFGEICPLCNITHIIGIAILGLSYRKEYLSKMKRIGRTAS